ncbi:phosphoribosyl-ATP diphosphatase [Ancylobacter sp. A5.8]|uniref:phosphoribosyl-ATP diphosphatase n=1 Tax=Ancylobacter gelatini TaxID=2919920 RepID=UPI001F4D5752|nr:phosphoribosyl-ATP diphosphatase [Ancylobacter gelatini]MCJ8145172.1 phosphoribosyl-ATP diphosphatase [Ancylobacter gelatini]
MSDSIRRLHEAVLAARKGSGASPRTVRLFAKGRAFISKKVAEEGVEVALDGVTGNAPAVVSESADLFYNLVVLWAELGIQPEDVWAEMRRREQLLGLAEKLPKRGAGAAKRTDYAAGVPPLLRGLAGEHAGEDAVIARRGRG